MPFTVYNRPVLTEGPLLITLTRLGPSFSLWISLSLRDLQINFFSLWVFQKRKSNNYLNKRRLITFNQKFCTYQEQISFQVWSGYTTQIHTHSTFFFPSHSCKVVRCWLLFPRVQPKKDNSEAGIHGWGETPLPNSRLLTVPKFSLLTLILLFP